MARPMGTKNIDSPEKMWQLFAEYKKVAKANPIKVKDWVGGMGKQVTREKEVALTMEDFEEYLCESGILADAKDYFSNKDKRYTEYVSVCSRIKNAIRADQIRGGLAGIYNPSITQRLNGLTEKIQEDGKKEVTINVKRGDRNKADQ